MQSRLEQVMNCHSKASDAMKNNVERSVADAAAISTTAGQPINKILSKCVEIAINIVAYVLRQSLEYLSFI